MTRTPPNNIAKQGSKIKKRPPTKGRKSAVDLLIAGLGSKLALLGILFVVMGAMGWLKFQYPTQELSTILTNQVVAGSAKMGFVVKNLLVEGRTQTHREEILEAIDLKQGSPIFRLSPEEIKTKIESIPWVRTATIERRLPDTLYASLTERRPMAIWQSQKRFYVVDEEGIIIQGAAVDEHTHLPLIVGDMTAEKTSKFLSELAVVPELDSKVQAATLVNGRRWNIRLDYDVDVLLPEENLPHALHLLGRLLHNTDILERNLTAIDLRQKGKILLRLGPGISLRSRGPSQAT